MIKFMYIYHIVMLQYVSMYRHYILKELFFKKIKKKL